ncbi:MAG: HAMP domain-containing protein [Gammaproteobacteria bacterium]|nr:HAMP domain-containing protein [Gammaproteobacteria bacterium]
MTPSPQRSLRTRFVAGMVVMLLPWAASLVVGRLFLFPQVTGALEAVAQGAINQLDPIAHLQILIWKAAMPPNDYLINGDPVERQGFMLLSRKVDLAFEKIRAEPFDRKGKQRPLHLAREEWWKAKRIAESLLTIPHPVGDPAAAQAMKRMDRYIDQAVDALDVIHGRFHRKINHQLSRARAIEQRVTLLIVDTFVLSLVITLGTAVWLARSVLAPLRELQKGVDHFGAGDLSHRIALDSRDEMGQLAAAFNAMAERLQRTQSRLEDLSIHDALTGLYNRREFQRRLKQELDRSRRYRRPFAL